MTRPLPRPALHPSETANRDVVKCTPAAPNRPAPEAAKRCIRTTCALCAGDIPKGGCRSLQAKTALHKAVILVSSSQPARNWRYQDMSSSNVGQVLPASAFSYCVSLRARHPTLDLKVLTDRLHL